MDMEHLTLVEGQSRETIEAKLSEAGIDYLAIDETNASFFRSCSIRITHKWNPERRKRDKVDETRILEVLGYPGNRRSGSYFYYAKYEIDEGFDLSQVTGRIIKGLLVERTQIYL